MGKENFHGGEPPLQPFQLPEALAQFLQQSGEYVMVSNSTDQGTVYVVKAPEWDIMSMSGSVPIRVTHELYREPEAPVIRSLVRFYDDPQAPLSLETFTNVRDQEQRSNFDAFLQQPNYIFTFYNPQLHHRLTKVMENTNKAETGTIFRQALLASSRIPDGKYNFDHAKASVMRKTRM